MKRTALGQRGRRGAQEGAYRGPDRRARREQIAVHAQVQPSVLGVVLLALVGCALWLASDVRFASLTEPALSGVRSAALVLSLVLAATVHLHWRTTGEASGALIRTSAWLLVLLAGIDLASGAQGAADQVAVVRSALSLVAAVWVARAVTGCEIDVASRPVRELTLALAAAMGAVVITAGLARSLGLDDHLVVVTLHVVAFVTWFVAAALGLRRASRSAPVLIGWVAWLGVAFTGAEAARVLALVDGDGWLFVSASARSGGLLMATIGCVSALSQTAVARRDGLHHAELRTRELADSHLAEREFQAHELRNALMAIEGATATLTRYRDRLSSVDRERLDQVVANGFTHLRSLAEPSTTGNGPVAVSLWEVASRQASTARTRGMDVEVKGDSQLYAAIDQRSITQVLENLLVNAARHGTLDGRACVTITVLSVADRAVLHVRDHGPGVPTAQRQLVFEPGVRLHPSREGDGVGLHLSRQLVRQFGGELTVEDALGGGARFVVSLLKVPSQAAPSSPAGSGRGGARADEGQDGGQVVQLLRDARGQQQGDLHVTRLSNRKHR